MRKRITVVALAVLLGLGVASAASAGPNHGCPAHNGNSQIGSCGNGQQPPDK